MSILHFKVLILMYYRRHKENNTSYLNIQSLSWKNRDQFQFLELVETETQGELQSIPHSELSKLDTTEGNIITIREQLWYCSRFKPGKQGICCFGVDVLSLAMIKYDFNSLYVFPHRHVTFPSLIVSKQAVSIFVACLCSPI